MYHHSTLDLKDSSRPTFHASRKSAFTLAELLITLGIIGVVAALVIPTLISKYNEMVTVNQLRKTYAELQQVIKLSEVQNGELKEWDFSIGSVKFAEKYIFPYLSGNAVRCNNSYNDKCISGNRAYRKPNKELAGEMSHLYTPIYKYHDKTLIIATAYYGDAPSDAKYATFIVDINGDKGESIMGKDVFQFTLFNYYRKMYGDSAKICSDDQLGLYLGDIGGNQISHCATSVEEILSTRPRGGCNMTGTGVNCGLAIEKNNWKIPKNYPIKF